MRVVLVDPSRTVLKFVARLLEARGDEVRPFTDGRVALAYVKDDPSVDALITSAEPLSISGLELCWETRLLAGERRAIYVILMSSNQERRNLIEALDSGADDFIGKPPVAEELYARLRAAERLASMHRDLMQLASLDSLTGIFNRRAFFERAEETLAQVPAIGTFSAIMLDIDHFKRINDVHGHPMGDRAIRDVASVIAGTGEIVGRLGGEEFAVLLPGRNLAAGAEIAERLRGEMAALRLNADDQIITLTCSLGVSEWHAGESVDDMLRRADMALYTAKRSGRDQVVRADESLAVTDYDTKGRPVRAAPRADEAVPVAADSPGDRERQPSAA
jgi:two-component system, cell cycle response regulator